MVVLVGMVASNGCAGDWAIQYTIYNILYVYLFLIKNIIYNCPNMILVHISA